MAEERVLIIKLKQKPCDSCNVIRGCAGSCILESKWYSSITRQEAIERMAKAICSKWGISSCKSCAFKGDGSMCQDFIDGKKSLAEAALNALLEGK